MRGGRGKTPSAMGIGRAAWFCFPLAVAPNARMSKNSDQLDERVDEWVMYIPFRDTVYRWPQKIARALAESFGHHFL